MSGRVRQTVLPGVLIGAALALVAPAASEAAIHLRLIATPPNSGAAWPMEGAARTADGALHVVFYANGAPSGEHSIGAISISPTGHVGPQVPVASNWFASTPTLITQENGSSLLALWGGNAENGSPSLWGSSSANGTSWSTPVDEANHDAVAVGGGVQFQEGGGQWGTPIAEAPAGAPPALLLSGSCIPVQIGLGSSSSTYYAQGACGGTTDEASGIGTTAAVDAATGEVVAGWAGQNTPQQFLQGVAPNVQSAQQVPGVSSGREQELAGRDTGPGVFAPYVAGTGGSIGTHVNLARYGGGSVSVGSVPKLNGDVLGAATGLDGRIWVMWGTTSGTDEIAVTRSNKAVTRFEPIQLFNPKASGINRIFGDGRLGPLDLLVRETPANSSVTGLYYARVLPKLSASVSVTKLGGGKFKVKVKITDAGDAVSGASTSTNGRRKSTDNNGKAKLVVSGSPGQHVTVKITDPGYQTLKIQVKL
jgi:hypothetical protein